MVNINWTNEAEVWLEDIFNFISEDSKKIAKKVVKEIFEKVQILQMFPKLGYKYYEDDENLRILLYGYYRIAYLIIDENNIDILGVFHGSLDIQRYL